MGLGDCEKCWDADCICDDGHGWTGYNLERLKLIRASIDAAIKRKSLIGRIKSKLKGTE